MCSVYYNNDNDTNDNNNNDDNINNLLLIKIYNVTISIAILGVNEKRS